MVEVKIYPACLKCDCPKYGVNRKSWATCGTNCEEYIQTNNIMECEHERVCKLIDGQEPIEIEDKIADLVVDDEKSVIATCSACKANYITIDHHLEHLDYCTRCGAKFERNMVREYLNGEPIETGNTGGK